MRVLVTGGAGFIGSHIVDSFAKKGHEVTVIDSMTTAVNYKNPAATYIRDDLSRSDAAAAYIKNFDIVFHLASNYSVIKSTENPRFDFENNFLLTFNVLDAMRRNNVKKIVFTSTSAVYGLHEAFPIKESTPFEKMKPVSNYAASKLASEIYIHSFSKLYGIDGLILRLANVVGPRSDHGIVPDLVKKLRKDPSKLEVLGNGLQKKSYIHIDDCISGILLASQNFKGFNCFNIGTDSWVSVNEIVDLVCKGMGVSPEITYTGGQIGWKGDVPEFLLDISKLKSIGWKPRMNSKEAIEASIKWLVQTIQ